MTHAIPEDLEQKELEAYPEENAALTSLEDVGAVDRSLSDTVLVIMVFTCNDRCALLSLFFALFLGQSR